MKQGIDMNVNRLPARTWNWLKMNGSSLSQITAEGGRTPAPQLEGDGIFWETESPRDVDWASIATGMGPDMDRLGELAGAPEGFLMNRKGNGRAFFDLSCEGGREFHRVGLYAAEGTVLEAVFLCRSEKEAKGLSALQLRAFAQTGAKIVIYVAQLFGKDVLCLGDLGVRCEEKASVKLVRLDLGAGSLYAGGEAELFGAESSFEARIGYAAGKGQHYDMNYTARHRGKKTESLMEASGVLEDGAFKLFRGTIDFLPGCAGAKGNETEDVLLLGEEITNQTIPLILCGEEDVEGNHGASMGRLGDQLLFYLESRGISREKAEQMMARARIDAVCAMIPQEQARRAVRDFLGEEETEE